MSSGLFDRLHLKGFLSFAPDSAPIKLTRLNVLIGPNGSGKSNFIEAIELLHATAGDFREAIRIGGAPSNFIWNWGTDKSATARIEAVTCAHSSQPPLRYAIEFAEQNQRLEIVDEVLENAERDGLDKKDVFYYYRFQAGHPAINMASVANGTKAIKRHLRRETIDPEQSILSQKRDTDLYPELTRTAERFNRIQTYREWSFGRSVALRSPQSAQLANDRLLPSVTNLGLVLNELFNSDKLDHFNELMARFLPRFKRVHPRVQAGTVQLFLHETGLKDPVPATRLSDGTLRFLSLLAILLNAESASMICIEEPELGMHPDAMTLLAELLGEASKVTQVVVTTHSDTLISELTDEADSVLVCDHLGAGTEVYRLESAKLQFWLDQYRLGEVWRLGKLGGNPI